MYTLVKIIQIKSSVVSVIKHKKFTFYFFLTIPRGVPHFWGKFGTFIFCYIGPYANFQNPKTMFVNIPPPHTISHLRQTPVFLRLEDLYCERYKTPVNIELKEICFLQNLINMKNRFSTAWNANLFWNLPKILPI